MAKMQGGTGQVGGGQDAITAPAARATPIAEADAPVRGGDKGEAPASSSGGGASSGGGGGGWLEGLGNWWNDITGQTAKNAAAKKQAAADKELASLRAQEAANAQAMAAERASAMQAVNAAMGGSVQDYLGRMQASAAPMAESEAQNIATQGTRQAIMTGRTGGLNPGQSALAATRQAGDLYSGAYTGALERGRGLYQQGVGQFQNMAQQAAAERQASQANRLSSTGMTLQSAADQQARGQQEANTFWSTAGNVAGSLLASDERLKSDIEPAPSVDEIAEAVRPVQYRYNDEEPGTQRVGVLAQDLEQSPLSEAVIDTPEGKMVDTAQLTPALLDMVIQLTDRINALEGKKNA